MPRSNDAVIEDLAFLQDQRTMKRGVISDQCPGKGPPNPPFGGGPTRYKGPVF